MRSRILLTLSLMVAALPATAHTGSGIIVITRDEIVASGAQSVQQVLRDVPAITGFGNAGQGAYGSGDAAGTFAPTLHGLGAATSNATLVLIDGRRFPTSGVNHTLTDPDVIAPLAIERIELLPDGASALYGSDAAAGVINVVTRRGFAGLEAHAQSGFASHYHTYSAGALWGTRSDAGSLRLNYAYEFRSHLLAGHRSFSHANHTLLDPEAGVEGGGAGDFANNNCSPATVTTAAGTFVAPYTGAAVSNADCDFTWLADLVPETQRHHLLAQGSRNVSERLTLDADLVWSRQDNVAAINRGAVTGVRTWGAGSTAPAGQVNPFFAGPPGATTGTVSWQADELLGSGASNRSSATALSGTLAAHYRFDGDWRLDVAATVGHTDSRARRDGALCTSCAVLALNGTLLASGAGPAQQALTAANALDVWNPAATNRTSAALRAQLLDSARLQQSHQTLRTLSAGLDGTLLTLPTGPVRLALGADVLERTMSESLQQPRGNGPASSSSLSYLGDFSRSVQSVQGSLSVPLVGAEQGHPGLRRLQLELDARHDRYSDIGGTTSPRFGFDWDLTRGFTLRGNAGRSFVAPALSSRGDANGVNSESALNTLASAGTTTGTVTLPASYPGVAQLQALNLPGCTAGSATCLLGNSVVNGLQRTGGNAALGFATARTYSLGFDLQPQRWPQLQLHATYWNARYRGAIVAPTAAFIAASRSLGAQALTIYPAGASAAQIAAATAGLQATQALPAAVYFILSTQQRNALDMNAAGVDADVRYAFDTRRGAFVLRLAMSRKVQLDQQFGDDGVSFSTLNTVGVNAAFPSNRLAGRFDVDWRRAAWSAQLRVNYEGFYRNWGATAAAGNAAWSVQRVAGLYPVGGGEPIESYTTIDLHAARALPALGLVLSLDATNLFDNRPPFFNTAVGYDAANASPIDRVLSLGVTRRW